MDRRSRPVLGWRWVGVLLVLTACGPEQADLDTGARSQALRAGGPARDCQEIRGTFTDVFLSGPECASFSPIALCTKGQLEGDLSAEYDFFFTTVTSTGARGPAIHQHFTGESHLTFTDGTLFSEDHGEITLKQQGESPFVTKIEFVSGTGAYADVTGRLIAIGKADFSTGLGSGTYHGRLCGLPTTQVANASAPQDALQRTAH